MRDDGVTVGGVFAAAFAGIFCVIPFCWDALRETGLTAPVLFGVCTLAAAAPYVYMYSR